MKYGCIYTLYLNSARYQESPMKIALMTATTNPIIHLHPDDNIAVCTRALSLGQSIEVGSTQITLSESVEVGHKIACQSIGPGDRIIKYGAPIGSATMAIAAGDHVHLHNMKSDYIPSHTRQARHGGGGRKT